MVLLSQSEAVCQGMLPERYQISIDLKCPLNVYFIISLWEIGNNLECGGITTADQIDKASCFIKPESYWLLAL